MKLTKPRFAIATAMALATMGSYARAWEPCVTASLLSADQTTTGSGKVDDPVLACMGTLALLRPNACSKALLGRGLLQVAARLVRSLFLRR